MISLHKFHSHVYYEEVYYFKRIQKFNIKTRTSIACLDFKSEQKTGFDTLGLIKDCIELVNLVVSRAKIESK